MLRRIPIGLALLLLATAGRCSTTGAISTDLAYAGVYMPDTSALRSTARCEKPRHHRVFYFFYGSTMIDRRDPALLFPDTGSRFYLIEQTKTASDWVVSVLFGTLFTVTRSSLYITECEIPDDSAAIAPFRASPTDASIDDGAHEGQPAAASSETRPGAHETRPERPAEVQKRIDAARERARAARERAEKLRRQREAP